jgi:tetratricopeptide (TPR) repeat protein
MKKFVFIPAVLLLMASLAAQQTTAPAGQKPPPQAKTQKEYADYNTAYALSGGAAMEKAASDFATAYPNSELRLYLYAKAMHEYQNENNSAKMLEMGRKVLGFDPDNSIALVLTANVLADGLSDTDTDRQQKVTEIRKNSEHALQTVDSGFIAPPNATPEQVITYKDTLRSMARSALGIMELKTGDNAAAEKDLMAAAQLAKSQPDPYVLYHLALAQDKQNKYPEALASITQALQNMGSNADLAKLANGERERLLQLTGGTPPSGQKPPP